VEQDIKIFENEGYTVEAAEGAGCHLSVKIVVKPKSAQKAYQKAVKKVNKQISIPGFRKGRAPDRTVITRYGSYVEQEWKESLVNDAYHAAVDLTTIYPLNKESIQKPKIESCSQEEGAIIHLAYEHYPHVPFVEFSQIKMPPIERREVADEAIEEILEEVRRQHADWEDVVGRGIEESDFAEVSIYSLQEDPPKQIVKESLFEVSEKQLPLWLKQLLLGLHIDESVEGESAADEEADETFKKNFKPQRVRITLHAIKKILLPEVNDELAKQAGSASVEALRSQIRQNLEKDAEENAQQKRFEMLENTLLDKYHFDLPASIVASEIKERLSRRIQALKNANVTAEEIKIRKDEIEKEVAPEADRALRLYFINKQIAKQGEISLSNQELNDEIVRYFSQNPYLYKSETDDAATRDLVSRMANALMQRKTKEYALSQVEAA
jgi:trigger factor